MEIQEYRDPEPRASAGQARLVADQLRQQPGKWAIIEEYDVPQIPEGADSDEVARIKDLQKRVRAKASSRASLIKQGRVAAFKSLERKWPGTFEAVSRTEPVKDADDADTGARIIRVYAKYRGEEFAAEPTAKGGKHAADGSGPSADEAQAATPVDQVVGATS